MRRRPKLLVKPNVAPKATRGQGTGSKEASDDIDRPSDKVKTEADLSLESSAPEPIVPAATTDSEQNPSTTLTATPESKKDAETKATTRQGAPSARRSRIRPQVQVRGTGRTPASAPRPTSTNDPPAESPSVEKPAISESAGPLVEEEDKNPPVEEPKTLTIAKPAGGESLPKPVKVEEPEPSTSKTSPAKDPQKAAARRSRFLKARPNLAEAGRARLRHPSFSQSEVEESPRKVPAPVQRTTSLSSVAASGSTVPHAQPSAQSSLSVDNDGAAVLPPVQKDLGSDVPDGGKAATVQADAIVKEAPVKKRRKLEVVEEPIDRSKITMKDLIYMNPSSNRMKSTVEEEERKRKKKKEDKGKEAQKTGEKEINENKDPAAEQMEAAVEEDAVGEEQGRTGEDKEAGVGKLAGAHKEAEEEEEEDAMPVPQVSIGPDGQIILNEASLVIANTPEKTVDMDAEVVHEKDGHMSFMYGRRRRTKLWSLKETKRFYVALSIIGTDFSLMDKFFPNRDRTELKKKFKREEKMRRCLVDSALKERHNFDISILDESSDEEEQKAEKPKKVRKPAAPKDKPPAKKKPRKKKKTKSRYYSTSESDTEEVQAGPESNPEAPEVVDLEKEEEAPGKRPTQRPPRLSIPSTSTVGPVTPSKSPLALNSPSPSPLKSPGQFISLSSVNNNAANVNVNQMQPGQFVFVTSTPPAGKPGQKPTQLIHVYRVSPSGSLNREVATPKSSPATSVGTPGSHAQTPVFVHPSPVSQARVPDGSTPSKTPGTPVFLQPSPVARTATQASTPGGDQGVSTHGGGASIVTPGSCTTPARTETAGSTSTEPQTGNPGDRIEPLFKVPYTPRNRASSIGHHDTAPVDPPDTPTARDSADSSTISANICVPVGEADPSTGQIVTDITHLVQSGLFSASQSGTQLIPMDVDPDISEGNETVNYEVIQQVDAEPGEKSSPGFSPPKTSQGSPLIPMEVQIPAGIDPTKIISFETSACSSSPKREIPIAGITRVADRAPVISPPGGSTVVARVQSPAVAEESFKFEKMSPPKCQLPKPELASPEKNPCKEEASNVITVSVKPPSGISPSPRPPPTQVSVQTPSPRTTETNEESMIECEIINDDEDSDDGNYITVEWVPDEDEDSS